ncbi:MAG: glutaminyl-peptide cyclotransferase [Chitinophagaceae bacterium]
MRKIFAPALLILLFSCNNSTDNPNSNDGKTGIPASEEPKALSYSVVEAFPHDTSSFTEGLLVYKGDMYEGTGNYGRSHLMKVDIKTGKALKKLALDPKFFGEGVTILHDTVYQLTYFENVVFVYTLPDFKKVKEFVLKKECWGLTNDGTSLIMSDGSSNLDYYDPSTFTLQRTQSITQSGEPVPNINELEYIDGYIYANQWQFPYILKIDPASGTVIAKADLTKLWDKAKTIYPRADVPNGIAYDSSSKKIYLTGKYWPELYQVEFSR